MAATTELASRIERNLHAILADVLDLPEWAAEWDGMTDGERASTSLEWDHMMSDYLTELDEHYRAGVMSSDQLIRYRQLLGTLREALSILEQLKLRCPPVSFED